jgi:hypothetical protein
MATFRSEAPAIDIHLIETHRQARELLVMKDTLVSSWKGRRWGISDEGWLWLDIGWSLSELGWVLDAAFKELGHRREPLHMRSLAAWMSKVLARRIRRKWRWGIWSLTPHPCGATLQIESQKPQK